jgi:hypothetical protein
MDKNIDIGMYRDLNMDTDIDVEIDIDFIGPVKFVSEIERRNENEMKRNSVAFCKAERKFRSEIKRKKRKKQKNQSVSRYTVQEGGYAGGFPIWIATCAGPVEKIIVGSGFHLNLIPSSISIMSVYFNPPLPPRATHPLFANAL